TTAPMAQDPDLHTVVDTIDVVRFAVLVGGQWYVTAEGFSMDADGASYNSWATTAKLIDWEWSSEAADWLELNLTPDSDLSLGSSPSADLTGQVDGIGLYGQLADDSVIRLNDLQAIPEPATMSLLALGGMGVLLRKRR
ncbi:MAG: PEP-CTERM sorting domain-containing protein, partial [Phycisphaerae bacterium]